MKDQFLLCKYWNPVLAVLDANNLNIDKGSNSLKKVKF